MQTEEEPIAVSVLCMVYNHEPFLRKCLDGFVSQETNFPFEVIIHDDKSTDHSADIIREYAERYPGIIRPIYQKENQYSKGVKICDTFMSPLVRGRYCALCEGDDYWCDPHKLQKQFDYMEEHPECTLCSHNSIYHYLNGAEEDYPFNDWKEVHVLNDMEIFMYDYIHTSSFFYRPGEVVYPDYAQDDSYWFGDYLFMVLSHQSGDVACLPGVMSVYNAENPNSVTGTIISRGTAFLVSRMAAVIDFLTKFDQATEGRFHDAVQERITADKEKIEYYTLMLQMKELVEAGSGRQQIIACAQQLENNRIVLEIAARQTGIHRLTFGFRRFGYRYCYHLWKTLMNIKVLSKVKP